MRPVWTLTVALLAAAALLTACSAKAPAKAPAAIQPTVTNASPPTNAKPPNPAFAEVEYQPVTWILGAPPLPAGSGVWVYTKAQHPGSINASVNWDKKDLVLVQLPGATYTGYKVTVQALQDLGGDVVRIVCKLEAPRPDMAPDKERHPAAWLEVPAGALTGRRFIVADEHLQELPTD